MTHPTNPPRAHRLTRTSAPGERPTYVVRLRPVAGMTEEEGLRGLRAFLKFALRAFGLKCELIDRVEPPTAQEMKE